jgi:hypothetical protein
MCGKNSSMVKELLGWHFFFMPILARHRFLLNCVSYLGSLRLCLKGTKGKAAGVWGSLPTFTQCPGQQWARLYLHSFLSLHEGYRVSVASTLPQPLLLCLIQTFLLGFLKVFKRTSPTAFAVSVTLHCEYYSTIIPNTAMINCVNFWVFPQRLFYIGRRFGTLWQVHLQWLVVGPDRGFRNVSKT